MSRIEDSVCELIQKRAAMGLEKYGTTVERNDLTQVEWLRHLQAELLDAAIYAERIIVELEERYRELDEFKKIIYGEKGNGPRDI